ncbi:YcxB family protein [Ornithinibacillus xuwenensis]|uniref:YcxB family protein n=1 Tax=Ornithinibacillus xuwenensis TaxID=3144668 RepID=A0ABU9XNC0_9BACI
MYIKGELKINNLNALQQNYLHTSEKVKRRLTIATYISAVLVFMILSIIQPSLHPIHVAIHLITAILLAMLVPYIVRQRTMNLFRKSELNKRLGPFSLHLTEKGIEVNKKFLHKQVSWKEIRIMASDEKHLFLYQSNQSAIIIPKAFVGSMNQLVEYISKYASELEIKSKIKTKFTRKQKGVLITLLVIVLALLVGMDYYYF